MTTATDLRLLVGAMSPSSASMGLQGLQLPINAAVGVGVSVAAPQEAALPRIKPELNLNDSTLFAVYCFIKNFIGASGTSAVAIDNKIEQAMDLVKSHLMFAVREEVEVLKEKISELMERINQLELENNILRAHATQETLSQLPVIPIGTAAVTTKPQPPNPANGSIS